MLGKILGYITSISKDQTKTYAEIVSIRDIIDVNLHMYKQYYVKQVSISFEIVWSILYHRRYNIIVILFITWRFIFWLVFVHELGQLLNPQTI